MNEHSSLKKLDYNYQNCDCSLLLMTFFSQFCRTITENMANLGTQKMYDLLLFRMEFSIRPCFCWPAITTTEWFPHTRSSLSPNCSTSLESCRIRYGLHKLTLFRYARRDKMTRNFLHSYKKVLVQPGIQLDWIAGLLNPDCNPVWWIGFGLSIQFLHFNPNPKAIIFLIKKPKTNS